MAEHLGQSECPLCGSVHKPESVCCPRCDGTGHFWENRCRLCDGTGRCHEDAASEYLFAFERERLEAS